MLIFDASSPSNTFVAPGCTSNSFLSADESYFGNSLSTMSTSTPNGSFLATESGSSTSDIPFTYKENFKVDKVISQYKELHREVIESTT